MRKLRGVKMTPEQIKTHIADLKRTDRAIRKQLKERRKQEARKDNIAAAWVLFGFLAFMILIRYSFSKLEQLPATPQIQVPDWQLPWWMTD